MAAAKESARKVSHSLLSWNDLPSWQRDNHYIISGYRPPSNSYLQSVGSSLFQLHNETVNVYTHFVGAVIALGLAVYFYSNRFWLEAARIRYATATPGDVAVLSCFFIGAAGCLGMSATFHAISNHSPSVAAFGNRLDYLGIVLLIWGSFVPTLYYAFKPEEWYLVRYYWSMVSSPDLSFLIMKCIAHLTATVPFFKVILVTRCLSLLSVALLTFQLDYDAGYHHRHNSVSPIISDSSITPFSRGYVRCHGPISCLSRLPWALPLRLESHEARLRPRLGLPAGCVVHCWCWYLCGT